MRVEDLFLARNKRVIRTWNLNESWKRRQSSWNVIHSYISHHKIIFISNKYCPSQSNIIFLSSAKILRIKRYYLRSKKISKSKIYKVFNLLNSASKISNYAINKLYSDLINQGTTRGQLINAKASSFWSKYHWLTKVYLHWRALGKSHRKKRLPINKTYSKYLTRSRQCKLVIKHS